MFCWAFLQNADWAIHRFCWVCRIWDFITRSGKSYIIFNSLSTINLCLQNRSVRNFFDESPSMDFVVKLYSCSWSLELHPLMIYILKVLKNAPFKHRTHKFVFIPRDRSVVQHWMLEMIVLSLMFLERRRSIVLT